eukprot:scaffold10306_cov40-Phaeocystis_antarctica.AAC.1
MALSKLSADDEHGIILGQRAAPRREVDHLHLCQGGRWYSPRVMVVIEATMAAVAAAASATAAASSAAVAKATVANAATATVAAGASATAGDAMEVATSVPKR